jgi:DNA-binding response OmpR family regulator
LPGDSACRSFVTAFSVESDRARALKAGATCYLTKPFDGEALIACLDAALKGKGGATSKWPQWIGPTWMLLRTGHT